MIIPIDKYSSVNLNKTPSEFWRGFPSIYGKSVFIKPNLVNPIHLWDKCSTTHVSITELIIQKVMQEGAKKIIVGDCGFKDQWEVTLKSTGYDLLPEKYPIQLIGLQEGPNFHKFTLQRIPKGKYLSLFGAKFSDYMRECDVVINVAKLKIHKMAIMTGCIKNMMGTMAQKGSMHPNGSIPILHKRLRDLYLLTSQFVQFNVIDGIIGSQYSEQNGIPHNTGVLISGVDQWECDVTAGLVMGLPIKKIPYLRYIQQYKKSKLPTISSKYVHQYVRPIKWSSL